MISYQNNKVLFSIDILPVLWERTTALIIFYFFLLGIILIELLVLFWTFDPVVHVRLD